MDQVTASGLEAPAHDVSLIGLFMQASIIVQVVMIGLVIASIWSWGIIFDKWSLFKRVKRGMDRFEKVFWSGQSLDQLFGDLSERNPRGMGAIFVAAMTEWKRSHERGAASSIGLQTRIDKVMDVALAREADRLGNRLTFLATIGSAGPFIGLFGTVIGIMASFQAIAGAKNVSLAVVAPGIAEALFATALGLLAAIPATIAYNRLSENSNKLVGRMEGFADEFSAILSRQIDERSAKAQQTQTPAPQGAHPLQQQPAARQAPVQTQQAQSQQIQGQQIQGQQARSQFGNTQ